MLFDTHMHTRYSCDGEMTYLEAIETAKKLGIGMAITEHWDYDYPTNRDAFMFDLKDYFEMLLPVRNDRVLVGIEIGMQTHIVEKDEALAAAYPFDYVLGAIHCMGRRDIYEPTCYEGYTRQEIIEEFFRDAIYCVEHHNNFDALAHIDYICRYWPYEGEEAQLRLEDSPEQFDQLLQLLINKGKLLEINTRRLDDPEAAKALLPIYERYYALGGRYCTLGSDAHYTEHVGRRIKVAAELAERAGLRPAYFKERKMELMKL